MGMNQRCTYQNNGLRPYVLVQEGDRVKAGVTYLYLLSLCCLYKNQPNDNSYHPDLCVLILYKCANDH